VLSVNINDKYSFKYRSSLTKCNGKEGVTFCMTAVLYSSLVSGYGEHWSFMKDRHSHTHTHTHIELFLLPERKPEN